jgi:hypothetical protein
MLRILDDALLLTETEVASEQFRFEGTDLNTVLRSAVEGASWFARSRGVTPWRLTASSAKRENRCVR